MFWQKIFVIFVFSEHHVEQVVRLIKWAELFHAVLLVWTNVDFSSTLEWLYN